MSLPIYVDIYIYVCVNFYVDVSVDGRPLTYKS